MWDNFALRVLPPQLTLDTTETFNDNVADLFTGTQSGVWTATGGRYGSTATTTPTFDTLSLGLDRGLLPDDYLEVQATLRTTGSGGLVFDFYRANDYKFVTLDVTRQEVVVGHVLGVTSVVDVAVAKALSRTPTTRWS